MVVAFGFWPSSAFYMVNIFLLRPTFRFMSPRIIILPTTFYYIRCFVSKTSCSLARLVLSGPHNIIMVTIPCLEFLSTIFKIISQVYSFCVLSIPLLPAFCLLSLHHLRTFCGHFSILLVYILSILFFSCKISISTSHSVLCIWITFTTSVLTPRYCSRHSSTFSLSYRGSVIFIVSPLMTMFFVYLSFLGFLSCLQVF